MTNFVRGGATKYIQDIIENIDAEHYILCGKNSDLKYLKEIKNLKGYKKDKFLANSPFFLLSFFSFFLFFKKNKFDIIHTNSTPAGLVGRITGTLLGSKVVHTVHAVPFENRELGFLIIQLERIASYFCEMLIYVSPKIKKMFESKKIKKKNTVIPIGIDVDKFKKAKKAKINSKNFKVITVSRLVKGKGLEKIVEIAKQFKKIDFIIVGDGPLKNKLKKRKPKNVILLGHKKNVNEILKSCDAFMLLSDHEGAPIVVYEAMAAGVPVITTDIGGISDFIKNRKTGFLVKNTAEAKSALKLAIANENLKNKIVKRAYDWIRKNDTGIMLKKTEKIYKSLYLKEN